MNVILSNFSASISELKKNPSALLIQSEGSPICQTEFAFPQKTEFKIPHLVSIGN